MINLDLVCLDNQSHFKLAVIDFLSICDSEPRFADTIQMNKCFKLNHV